MFKRKYSSGTNMAVRGPDAKKRRAIRKRRMSAFLLGREPKYLDTAINVTSLVTTGQVFALSDIAQGDNYLNRNGNLVQSKYLQYSYACNQAGGTLPIIFKMALVLDRQPNGTAPTFAQIFDTAVAPLVFCMKNVSAFQERFVILKEDVGSCTSAYGGDATQSVFKGFVNLQKLKPEDQMVRWGGTIATSPNTNGLYLAIVSNTVTANEATFRGCFRYVFNEQ